MALYVSLKLFFRNEHDFTRTLLSPSSSKEYDSKSRMDVRI